MNDLEKTLTNLTKFIDAHNEWLLIDEKGKTFTLLRSEIEAEISRKKILFSLINEKGLQSFRLVKFEFNDEKLLLDLAQNFGRETLKYELIPRVKSEILGADVEMARLERANKIARLLESETEKSKLERVELNIENGRFAQIILRVGTRYIAAISDVSDTLSPEIMLTSAILLLSKLERRKKKPVSEVWIIGEKKFILRLRMLLACLKNHWQSRVILKEISLGNSKRGDSIADVKKLKSNGLWRFKPKKITLETNPYRSEISAEITKLDPEKIDHIYSKQGETLRYLGLPFLRTREILGEEKSWFGIEKNRQVLEENSFEDFYKLFAEIEKYRSYNSPNKQHLFYQTAPEAWLESVLRKNIKLLDPNLILSPIYNQFRTSRDKIDLLALRKDRRLVIIELKVTQDREMVFQALDYWRKIELQRRKGILNKARLFGDTEIADEPAICYLVAPNLSFHGSFNFFAKSVLDEVEMYRFDLAENWREKIKVLGRKKI